MVLSILAVLCSESYELWMAWSAVYCLEKENFTFKQSTASYVFTSFCSIILKMADTALSFSEVVVPLFNSTLTVQQWLPGTVVHTNSSRMSVALLHIQIQILVGCHGSYTSGKNISSILKSFFFFLGNLAISLSRDFLFLKYWGSMMDLLVWFDWISYMQVTFMF